MTGLIGISQRKAVKDVAILARRLILARADFVMLNFSFEFHTISWEFDKKKLLMLMFLDLSRSVRCLCFPLEKTILELNFRERDTLC